MLKNIKTIKYVKNIKTIKIIIPYNYRIIIFNNKLNYYFLI